MLTQSCGPCSPIIGVGPFPCPQLSEAVMPDRIIGWVVVAIVVIVLVVVVARVL